MVCCLLQFVFGPQPSILFTYLDNTFGDLLFTIRGSQQTSGSVVIVDIDEASLKEYGQWPWPRDLMADLVHQIHQANPRVMGFDILFSEEDRTSPIHFIERYGDRLHFSPEGQDSSFFSDSEVLLLNHDKRFNQAISAGKTVLGYTFVFQEDFSKETTRQPRKYTQTRVTNSKTNPELYFISAYRPILNIETLHGGLGDGFLNILADTDGIVRHFPLYLLYEEEIYPTLALAMYNLANGCKEIDIIPAAASDDKPLIPIDSIKFPESQEEIQTDLHGQLSLNHRGGPHSFLYISAADVIAGNANFFLRDKYVILGSTAAGDTEFIKTPFSSWLPDVELHATLLDNIIQQDFLIIKDDQEKSFFPLLILLSGLTICLGRYYLDRISSTVLTVIVLLVPSLLQYILFTRYHFIFRTAFCCNLIFIIAAVGTLSNYLLEGRRRNFIKKAFGHYVSPLVINELLQDPKKLELRATTREVSILFCDIRDFTRYAEQASPEELNSFLNTYLSLLTDIILKNKGMVDKYIGDAIMAVWGTPLDDPEHAKNSVKAALEIIEAIERNRENLKTLDNKVVRIGIGINSGIVSAGNFGSRQRFDYTVHGDTVNLAARVENATKIYPVQLLITEYTRKLLDDTVKCRFIDTVQVKGREQKVRLYEPYRILP